MCIRDRLRNVAKRLAKNSVNFVRCILACSTNWAWPLVSNRQRRPRSRLSVPSLFRRECCHHPTHASRDTVLKARCQQVFSLSGPHAVESDAQLHPTRSASPRPAARSKAGAFRGKQALSHAETLHPSSLFLLSSAEAESLRHPGPVADRSTFDPRFQTHTTHLISTCHSCSLN